MYHQARVLYAKGDKAKAKELLTKVREKLDKIPQLMEGYLAEASNELLRSIDPNSGRRRRPAMPGFSREQVEQLERLQERTNQVQDPGANANLKKLLEEMGVKGGDNPLADPAEAARGLRRLRCPRHRNRLRRRRAAAHRQEDSEWPRGSLPCWLRAHAPPRCSSPLGLAGCESVRVGANPELPLWMHRPSGALDLGLQEARARAGTSGVGEPYERGQPEIDVARQAGVRRLE